jgi:hypothetical protein
LSGSGFLQRTQPPAPVDLERPVLSEGSEIEAENLVRKFGEAGSISDTRKRWRANQQEKKKKIKPRAAGQISPWFIA